MERCFILLLDDDEDDYQLIKSLINEAFGGTVKLDWYQRNGFADTMICSGYYLLTLVEYRLGNENGLEVIRKVKNKCPDQILILATSWDEAVVNDQQALQAGADHMLRKTELSIDTLKQAIAPYLALKPIHCSDQ